MTSAISNPPTVDDVPDDPTRPRIVAPSTRLLLAAFAVLTAVATNQLIVLAEHTDAWFSWTIRPPIAAMFLGAGYGAGCVLVVLALRVRHWVDARLPVVTVLVFSVLTLVATVVHRHRFHFAVDAVVPRFAAWFWLAVYVVVPVALVAVVVHQQLGRGGDPPRDRPVPPWLTAVLVVQGAVLLGAGGALFVGAFTGGHEGSVGWWPWALTQLTALMTGAWLIAFGVAAVLALWERDLQRLRIGAIGYTVFGVLQLTTLLRFHDDVRWGSPATIGWVVVLVSIVLAGAAGWRAAPRRRAAQVGAHR